jgi:hypothetical protein
MLVLPSQSEVRAERCRRSLRAFIGECWAIVEPARPFVSGWHLEAVCEYLEAASRGEVRRLVINIPPRHMKSLSVSVFWPAWCWLSDPERRFLYASYSAKAKHTLVKSNHAFSAKDDGLDADDATTTQRGEAQRRPRHRGGARGDRRRRERGERQRRPAPVHEHRL